MNSESPHNRDKTPEGQKSEFVSPNTLPPLIQPQSETPRQPPRHKGDETPPIDSLFVVQRILIPGFYGIIGSIILGIGLPSAIDSLAQRHTLAAMGKQVINRIIGAFDALAKLDFSGTFPLVLLFGFILGVFIRHAYGNDRIR